VLSRYIAVTDSPSSNVPLDLLLCDPSFKVDYQEDKSSNIIRRHVIVFSNQARKLKIRSRDIRVMHEWYMSSQALLKQTRFVSRYRYGSFAPIREKIQAKWYIDGQDYFSAVADAIEGATEKIYIEGWWVSPELVSLVAMIFRAVMEVQ
jgi:phospholipase D1/2